MTRKVDVLVVGAGPAGLAAAERAAGAGLDVLVVERQREIAEHVRTSGMTARTTVDRLGAPAETFHPIERLRFIGPGREAMVPTEATVCVLDVRAFYRWLGARAVAAGARIETATTAVAPIRDAQGAVAGCTLSSGDVHARVVVDAGGYRAHLSKRAGVHPGFERFGVGVELELDAPAADHDTAVLIVGERYAPTGYGWSFPCGGGHVRVGVGLHHSDTREDPAAYVRRVMDGQERLGLGLAGATVAETHRGLVPAEHAAERVVADGIVAVGDAAGQASLVAGEGIRLAIVAGELAGETVAAAVRRGDVGRAALARYEDAFARAHRRDLQVGARLNRRLARTRDDDRWDRRIDALASMPPELVVALLQAELPARPLLRWAARHPHAAASLLRAARA